jgi:hypothetical protein
VPFPINWLIILATIDGSSDNSGGLTFNRNISSGYKKAKGPSLTDWRSPAGRDTLNQFLLFLYSHIPDIQNRQKQSMLALMKRQHF